MDPATIALLAQGLLTIIDRIQDNRMVTDHELSKLHGEIRQLAVDAALKAKPPSPPE